MKKYLIAGGLLAAVALALGVGLLCVEYILPSRVAINDVREAEALELHAKNENGNTNGIYIHGSGEVDGEATISLLLGGEPNRVEKLNGRVDFEWGGDWYSETAEIRYEPANVRSGKVVLHYRFQQ
jgi:hypothetical protein